ncbi:MAG: flagellar hook-basal body complex protein [Lachnospiraceae bacterium]|nr:flagellar hook-basal body complex protein [Lachnospiraceae bacterium]
MMRSLFSGVAGLRTHQTRMDVIGNNIANVNTTAYKSQSMTFSDLMYQTTQAASGANATTGVGGTNARQIGLGSKTSAIKTNISGQGSAQSTNDAFDIMISGDAFFVVNNGSENFFTRDGSFYIDGRGNLAMTSNGYNVMGWGLDDADPTLIKKGAVQPLRIMTGANMVSNPEATSYATVDGIVDRFDTDVLSKTGKVMNLEFFDNQGYKYTARFNVRTCDELGKGEHGSFYVELDDIFDPSGKSIMKDEDGNDLGTGIKFGYDNIQTAGDPNATPPVQPANVQKTVVDAQGQEQKVDVTNAVILQFADGKGTFAYVGQQAGQTNVTGGTSLINFNGLPNFHDIVVDFSSTFNYNKNGTSTIGALAGDSANNGLGAGRKTGAMSGLTVQKDGRIYADYDNGENRLLGQIATATFANPSGLAKEGDNLYSATMNSGEFDGIGEDVTANGGRMDSGVLEMSNVDLAAEFTEMITTQRGFQANSRIITVSDTLLEELTNLKR